MKIRIPFVTAITSLALLCISPLMAQEEAVAIAPEQAELSDAEMLEIYGWMAGMRAGISRLGLNDEDMKAFILGIDAARSNRDLDVDLQAIGPMISEKEATRLHGWIEAAQAAGGTLLCGGTREGAMLDATLMENVPLDQDLSLIHI